MNRKPYKAKTISGAERKVRELHKLIQQCNKVIERFDMIGIKGKPLTATFEWARWRRSKRALIEMGATEVITDAEAKLRGYQVAAARRHYELTVARELVQKATGGQP